MNKQISEHFKLYEFQNSPTATAKGIDNTIPEKYNKNLLKLVNDVLEPVRQEFHMPIIVSSGYRCPELNKAVGGATRSDHMWAAAADIKAGAKNNKELFDLIVKMANEGKIECRQIIDEYNYKWLHISVNNSNNGYKNNQILHIK